MTSHYDTLGIARTATAEDVKRAYRKLAKQFHPDHNSGDKHAEERFLEISLAYEVLSDAVQRKSYDLNFGMGTYSFKEHKNIRHFFEVTADKTEVKVCEEFELTFTYSGEGRYLRKPEMQYFFITGKPFVHFSKIKIDGEEVKETSIAYTVCATAEGRHRLGEAFIKIDNKAYHSAPIYINVNASECFYSTKQITANGKPYRYKMFYVAESGGHAYRYSQNHRHTVLIPRSHKAKVVHDIGSGLKIVFTIWGLLLSASINLFPVAGAVLGSVYGALNAYILYWIMGVKPKFYFSNQYAAVRDLLEKGFLPGDETSSNYKIARVISLVSRIMV